MTVDFDMSERFVNIAQLVPCTEAEGPGRRCAIWVQGCPLRCAECCNPEMLSFSGGERTSVDTLLTQILQAQNHGIEGITLIGGEPFAHAASLAPLAAAVRRQSLSVMIFSGYTLTELQRQDCPHVQALLAETDLLIDGRYDRTQPDDSRRWIGSRNQQAHFLTDRYSAEDACWSQRDTLEVRWDGRSLTVNGFPARAASTLWKRPSGGAAG